MAYDLVNLKAGLAAIFADLTGKTAVVKAGEVGDEFDAHWFYAGGATPTTKHYAPFYLYTGASSGLGAAGRIRTVHIVLPAQMSLTHFRWKFGGTGGDATDRVGFALYSEAGAVVAKTGVIDPSGYANPSLHNEAVTGGPVTVPAGGYIWACGSKNGNVSFYRPYSPLGVPAASGDDPYWGYPAETTATGELPAAITVPIGTPDNQDRMAWVILIGS